MTARSFRYGDAAHPWLLLRAFDDYGLPAYDLLRPPGRFWADASAAPPAWAPNVDAGRTRPEPSPPELLRALPGDDTWSAMSRRSLLRLFAWFVVAEDPQHRLEAQPVAALAHQVSLVQHVLSDPHLQSVLIADEVGLGKTVEAALIVRHLRQQQPGLRVLYLAPARLVANVRAEMNRLDLPFRSWVAGTASDSQLDDPLVIASIHRAVVKSNFDRFVAAARWDVIIVDECHHLSAYGPDGAGAVRQYRLVDKLRRSLRDTGRLILLSGTPHQGNLERFANLLRLLCRDGEPSSAVSRRVIYRTKEDVRDWDGRPLFPARDVRTPIVLDLGEPHRAWLRDIHRLFQPGADADADNPTHRRAASWKCGQALQWATSSIEAGLGYLVRQALRAGWRLDRPILTDAIAALRPYRCGRADEPPAQLFERIRREIALQDDTGALEDVEDADDEVAWSPDDAVLAEVLRSGLALLATDRDRKWRALDRLIAEAGDDKIVFFAQPIETVMALARYLERTTGVAPALIIGNQTEGERGAQVDAFRSAEGPRFLVSSRAGGEGINLQVARRLIHVDVPWNPMELEQRIGRVHRFLSRRTILVDTLVVKNSREADMYEVARGKLREAASALAPDAARFEVLFSRVMALLPPDELQSLLSESATGPLTRAQRDQVADLVHAGFASWQAFHAQHADHQREIRALSPGEASWDDVARLASDTLGARAVTGYRGLRFEHRAGDIVEAPVDARVLRLGGRDLAIGDYGGMPVVDERGRPVPALGLNTAELQEALRRAAFPPEPAGAAQVRWPGDLPCPLALERPFGVLAVARLAVRVLDTGPVEHELSLRVWAGRGDAFDEITAERKGALIRGLYAATVRRDPDAAPALVDRLAAELARRVPELGAPTEHERSHRIRAAVFPLLAAVVS